MNSASASPDGRHGFIARVIAACARRPVFTILCVAAASVWGWFSLQRAPLDAIPDLSDVQVIVFTEWMGQSPTLVEDQVPTRSQNTRERACQSDADARGKESRAKTH